MWEQQVVTARLNGGRRAVETGPFTVLNTALNGVGGTLADTPSSVGSGDPTNSHAEAQEGMTTDAVRSKNKSLTSVHSSSKAETDNALIDPSSEKTSFSYSLCKRLLDIVGALIGLCVFSPVFIVIYLLIRLDSPGCVIYRRRVLAKQSYQQGALRTFDAFKFRTMIHNADEYLESDAELLREYQKEFKLIHDPRVTRVGASLRRWSMDEIPQLWNVLIGQMTLVGPRMISPPELRNYGPDAARLLSVKPGMTGLWQISGRTDLAYSERVRLDMYYIENRSLLLDFQILLRTIGCVLGRRGAV